MGVISNKAEVLAEQDYLAPSRDSADGDGRVHSNACNYGVDSLNTTSAVKKIHLPGV